MATLRWGMQDTPPATDIADLQKALNDLGYYTDIDGYFGPQTRTAVRALQRDNGLTVDGVVGPDTAAALGLSTGSTGPTAPAEPAGPAKGGGRRESLHIGINQVNPALYGGWTGALGGCENDCDTMIGLARAEGYTPLPALKTAAATSQAILDAIRGAAGRMTAGDVFMVTYAGHGGQVPNADAGVDPEADAMDETWVCYDRQVIDDELWRAWQDFAAGVTVVVISDSCHSGTIGRRFTARGIPTAAEAERMQAEAYQIKRAFYENLAVPRSGPEEFAFGSSFPRPRGIAQTMVPHTELATRELELVGQGVGAAHQLRRYPSNVPGASRSAPPDGSAGRVLTREMPLDVNNRDVAARGVQYAQLQLPGKVAVRSAVQCNVVSLSGCADIQLSQETNGHGVFTTTLHRTWANNTWNGSYISLIKTMEGQMGPTQTPQLGHYGPTVDEVLASTPF